MDGAVVFLYFHDVFQIRRVANSANSKRVVNMKNNFEIERVLPMGFSPLLLLIACLISI
jgi:hypothetical protein